MSLRMIAPRLSYSRCSIALGSKSRTTTTLFSPIRILNTNNASAAPHRRRGFSTSTTSSSISSTPKKPTTPEEVEAALIKANETMKAYYSYPPEKVIAAKKLKFEERHRDKQFYLQLALGMSLLCSFLITPFLGRKIAYDPEFRSKYIPSWYDYTIEKPKNAWTKEELHQEIMMLQKKLRERAIAGEFTPEKLEEMRRTMHKKPEKEEHAHFAKLHPGVDDDEELEDE